MLHTSHIFEETLGVLTFLITGAGALIAQLDPSLGGTFMGFITQFGGLGLAVWLVYHHTTKTIPEMQKEHRAEREAAIASYNRELEEKRLEFLEAVKNLATQHAEAIRYMALQHTEELKNVRIQCPYIPNNNRKD